MNLSGGYEDIAGLQVAVENGRAAAVEEMHAGGGAVDDAQQLPRIPPRCLRMVKHNLQCAPA